MRVIFCGGRNFTDRDMVVRAMEFMESIAHVRDEGLTVITGGARGADTLAHEVAVERGHETEVYPADWDTHGRAAGPIRNQQMLDTGVDAVTALPGGRGTFDMTKRASKAGVPVFKSPWAESLIRR